MVDIWVEWALAANIGIICTCVSDIYALSNLPTVVFSAINKKNLQAVAPETSDT